MFKGPDEGLHIEFCGDFVGAEIGEADFDLVAELGCLFFGLGDSGFVAFGDFDLDGFSVGGHFFAATGRGSPKGGEDLDEPRKVDIDAEERT